MIVSLYIVLSLLAVLFQSSFMHALSLAGVIPNLLVCMVVSFGLLKGQICGALCGLAAGLLQDLLFGPYTGFYALLFLSAGYFSGLYTKRLSKEHFMLPLLIISASELLYLLIQWILFALLRHEWFFGRQFSEKLLPEFIYTAIISLPVYALLWLLNSLLHSVFRLRSRGLLSFLSNKLHRKARRVL